MKSRLQTSDLLKKVKASRKSDCGWSTLPFIKDFTSAMKGFTDAPVTYPRNEENRSDEMIFRN